MSKKYTAIIIALAVLAAASAALYFFGMDLLLPGGEDKLPTAEFSLENSPYTAVLESRESVSRPLLPTGIDSLFYAANLDGEIWFYSVTPDGVVQSYMGDVKTVEAKVVCSHQTIPVRLSYLQKDGVLTGFGLFTSAQGTDVRIYDYVFCQLVNLPSAYGRDDALLLVDFNKSQLYSADKLYSDMFALNLRIGRAAALMVDSGRMVDGSGAFRKDWMLSDPAFLRTVKNTAYFLSGRHYATDQHGEICDIMTIQKSSNTPPIAAKGILGTWARVTDKGLCYLKSQAGGFASLCLADKKESVVKSFSGDYRADYIQSGDYILNKSSLALTNLLTGEEKTIDLKFTKPDGFCLSPDGQSIALLRNGVVAENAAEGRLPVQGIAYYSFSSREGAVWEEPLLFAEEAPGFVWLDNATLLHFRPEKDDNTGLMACFVKPVEAIAAAKMAGETTTQ